MKKILFSLLCAMTLISLTACDSKKDKDKEEPKSEEKDQAIIIDDQQIDNLSFENFNIVLDDNNVSHIYFEVVNNGTEASNVFKVTFILYKDDIQLLTITKTLNGPIEANDIRTIEASVDVDLSEMNKVEYIVE